MTTAAGSRTAMAYDDYVALDEYPTAEYVDGEVVVSPSPTGHHQVASKRLAAQHPARPVVRLQHCRSWAAS